MATVDQIKPMVRGCYDLQQLRMQHGLRIAANFRAKLKKHKDSLLASTAGTEGKIEADKEEEGKLSKEAEKILDLLRASYRNLTSGIARNRKLPAREGFIGDELIEEYSELVLTDQFIVLEREEASQFRTLGTLLEDVQIYREFLKDQKGVGPATAGALVSRLDPHKARYVSSFWKFAGLDVAPEACISCKGTGKNDNQEDCVDCGGAGSNMTARSRREGHLVERTYKDKKGHTKTRRGITYDPWLKTKMFVLAGSFLRTKSPWAEVYRAYKHRLETDPTKTKISVEEWKKKHEAGENVSRFWPPERIDLAARRFMIKRFLAELWATWRKLEGLPVTPEYHEAILGHKHGGQKAAE